MPRISKSQLLKVVSAANAARPPSFAPHSVPPPTSPKLLDARRSMEKLLAASLAGSGPSKAELNRVRKDYGAELERVVERQEADSLRRSAAGRRRLQAALANRRKALQTLQALPLAPYLYFLDKPFLIWAAPRANVLLDTHIESLNSWAKAKIAFETGGETSGEDRVSFYFLWDNPTDYYAVIDVSSVLGATGAGRAKADGGLGYIISPSYTHYSRLSVNANMRVWQWSAQPQTYVTVPSATVFYVAAEAGVFEDTRTTSVSDSFDLDYRFFVVQPRGVVVIEVILTASYSVYDGHVLANFGDGSYAVECPFVVIGLLSAPPPMPMMAEA